jgi:hypothetical protein
MWFVLLTELGVLDRTCSTNGNDEEGLGLLNVVQEV